MMTYTMFGPWTPHHTELELELQVIANTGSILVHLLEISFTTNGITLIQSHNHSKFYTTWGFANNRKYQCNHINYVWGHINHIR